MVETNRDMLIANICRPTSKEQSYNPIPGIIGSQSGWVDADLHTTPTSTANMQVLGRANPPQGTASAILGKDIPMLQGRGNGQGQSFAKFPELSRA